jgi:5-methylcytosine-specific restriction endonuclease McrA
VLPHIPWSIIGHEPQIYKKCIAGLPMQLGSRVSKARPHVPKTHDARAIMGMQDVWTDDVIITCETCGQDATVQLNSVTPHG